MIQHAQQHTLVHEADGKFEGVGGLHLYYRSWEAAQATAAIIVVHGLSDHSGRFQQFGNRMAAAGINVFAFDLRGHGASEGRRGHSARFDYFIQDVERFRREVECLTDGALPLFILGHSMGGLITLRYIEEYDVALHGAVLTSPWLATGPSIPRWKIVGAGFLNKLLPSLPIDNGIDAEYLSHDPAIVAQYREDPLVHGKITPRLFMEASTAMGLVLSRSDRIRMPLLFLLAGDDQIVDTRKSEVFAKSLSATDVTISVLPNYYHEVLNDFDRGKALKQIREWIAGRS
ncbi:MAG TPA: alpha/beta hydrolase [Longimicrobiales bacterium]|nr:alpha/beta hydrolase [Longimicrobiales bacterium]